MMAIKEKLSVLRKTVDGDRNLDWRISSPKQCRISHDFLLLGWPSAKIICYFAYRNRCCVRNIEKRWPAAWAKIPWHVKLSKLSMRSNSTSRARPSFFKHPRPVQLNVNSAQAHDELKTIHDVRPYLISLLSQLLSMTGRSVHRLPKAINIRLECFFIGHYFPSL